VAALLLLAAVAIILQEYRYLQFFVTLRSV
jgi:hypothetical protein